MFLQQALPSRFDLCSLESCAVIPLRPRFYPLELSVFRVFLPFKLCPWPGQYILYGSALIFHQLRSPSGNRPLLKEDIAVEALHQRMDTFPWAGLVKFELIPLHMVVWISGSIVHSHIQESEFSRHLNQSHLAHERSVSIGIRRTSSNGRSDTRKPFIIDRNASNFLKKNSSK
ncbi:hypothetical protein F2Q68_00009878 [Brassica cretica]|uniref:Uncharacterized protein n=1 Tax=Brassica cretica TaxID=69181 RepID=A0A8S9KZW8_BRACR|nr:hypothetical protein F2Q68_00009878 [Brassica cretica]